MSQPKDIGFVPGGVPALQPGLGNVPSGLVYPYQIANITAGGGLTGSQIANGTIGTNQIDAAFLGHVWGNLTQAQLTALGAGVTIANAVANHAYFVQAFSLGFQPGANAVAFTGGAVVVAQINSANCLANSIAASVITGNSATSGDGVQGLSPQVLVANQAVILTTANGANFAAGSSTGTSRYDLWYTLIPND